MLYQNANRDRLGGKTDLALQEFQEYSSYTATGRWRPRPSSGVDRHLHFAQGDYDDALNEFDQVLERYPANNKTPDAF